MDEEKFDFENPKAYQEMLRTHCSELQTTSTLDEILVQVTTDKLPLPPKRVLFVGEGVGRIASYMAGWMAVHGMEVIVLDGANRFDPYMVSSLARKVLIPPERVLKGILIARAFTCYQMANLIERLIPFAKGIHEAPLHKPRVILLGPITTFLDEDVSWREVWALFERSLKRIGKIEREGISFFLFQSSVYFNLSFPKGRVRREVESRERSLMKRLLQFSDLAWKVAVEDQELRMALVKGVDVKTLRKDCESGSGSRDLKFALKDIHGKNGSSFQ